MDTSQINLIDIGFLFCDLQIVRNRLHGGGGAEMLINPNFCSDNSHW